MIDHHDTHEQQDEDRLGVLDRTAAKLHALAQRDTHWLLFAAAALPVLSFLFVSWLAPWRGSGSAVVGAAASVNGALVLSATLVATSLLVEMYRRDRKNEREVREILDLVARQYQEHQMFLSRVVDATRQVSNFGDKFLQLQAPRGNGVDFGRFAKEVMLEAEAKLDTMVSEKSFTIDLQSPVKKFEDLWLGQLIQGKGSFKTISNLTIWSGRNLGFDEGADSKYLLRQLRACHEKDYRVMRVFIVPSYEMLDGMELGRSVAREARRVLERYDERLRDYARLLVLEKHGNLYGDEAELPAGIQEQVDLLLGEYQTRVFPVDEAEYRAHFMGDEQAGPGDRFSGNFAIFDAESNPDGTPGPRVVNRVTYCGSLTPASEGDLTDYEIRSIGFTSDEAIAKQKSEEFNLIWSLGRCMEPAAYRAQVLDPISQRPTVCEPAAQQRPSLSSPTAPLTSKISS